MMHIAYINVIIASRHFSSAEFKLLGINNSEKLMKCYDRFAPRPAHLINELLHLRFKIPKGACTNDVC